MKRLSATASIVVLLLLINFMYGHAHFRARDYDIAYIARHCESIDAEARRHIADHITYDGGIEGLYIFDRVVGQTSTGDFEAAYRSTLTELLCFPIVGCAIPPVLGAGCAK
jgi:hypothetical protein